MRIDWSKIFVALIALTAVSCSSYNKLLKSSDSDMKYRKAIELCNAGKYNKAYALLEDVAHIYAQSARADTVAYYTGLALYKMGDFDASAEVFDGFRRRFGRSPFLEDVEYMYAKGFYYASPSPEKDQSYTMQAMQSIAEYLDHYPNSTKKEALLENLIELRQKLFDKSFLNARVYYNIGYYNSAVAALKNAIREYPESNHREELSFLVLSSYYHYARNSVERMKRQRYIDTQDAYYSFVDEYPESKFRKEADKMLTEAKTYLDNYDKKHPDGTADESGKKDKDNSKGKNGDQEE